MTQSLSAARLDAELSALGYPRGHSFHGRAALVIEIPVGGDRIDGRYFPSRHAILLETHRDPLVTRALRNHELCHALQYERRCRGTTRAKRRKCGYTGDHDRGFYDDLEKMHRASGVPLRAALVVEREAGYAYPTRWDRGRW